MAVDLSQPTSQGKEFRNTRIASWNVRGCSTPKKRAEIDKALKDLGIDVACVQELHLTTGSTVTDNYSWFQGGNDNGITHRGVGILIKNNDGMIKCNYIPASDSLGIANIQIAEEKYTFITVHIPSSNDKRMQEVFQLLEETIRNLVIGLPESPIIIMGDWNAHLGKEDLSETDKQLIGPKLKHNKDNGNGTCMKLLLQLFQLNVDNTWSDSKTVLTTWTNGQSESQLDHIVSYKPDKSLKLTHIKAYWIKEVSTDHKIIKAEIKWNPSEKNPSARNKTANTNQRWNLERLKNPNEKLNYQLYALSIRYQDEDQVQERKSKYKKWEDVMRYTQGSATVTLNKPSSPNTPGRRKATAAVLKAQFQYHKDPSQANKEKLKIARVHKAKKVEEHRERKYDNFFKNITKLHPSARLHQTCKFLNKTKKTNKRKFIKMSEWENEIKNQMGSGQTTETIIESDNWPLSRPATLEEVKGRISEWKPNSAPGSDRISAELLKAAPEEILKDLHQILREAWISNEIPEIWTTTIQVPIPKVPAPKETGDYRRITLCSIAYKLHAKHMLDTMDKCTNKIPDYQAAFLPNRSTDDHTFTIRRILEEGWREGKKKYVLALDLAKAFDTVDHKAIIAILKHQKVPHFLINRIIKACLFKETSIIWYGQKTALQEKRVGVKQGCPLSPRIFTLVIHEVVHTTYEGLYTKDWENKAKTDPILLAYADDIILVAEKEENLEKFIKELIPNLESVGLKLNMGKCQIMIRDPNLSEEEQSEQGNLKVGNYIFPQAKSIKYLGVTLTNKLNRSDTTKLRIARAYKSVHSIMNALKKHKLPWNLLRSLYNTVIAPAAIYGLKTSAMTKINRVALRNMERAVLNILMLICRAPPAERLVFNLLRGRTINQRIRAQRIRYWAHIIRREESSTIRKALFLRANKKKVGRPCYTWTDSLSENKKKIVAPKEGWDEATKDKTKIKKITEELYNWQESSDSEKSIEAEDQGK